MKVPIYHSSGISDLLGQILIDVVRKYGKDGDVIVFICDSGRKFRMYHRQDCCETVEIESIVGNLEDLKNSPITLADMASNEASGDDDRDTWTFYKLGTVKGYVDIRWHGHSNGYYSEAVDFEEFDDQRDEV